MKDFLKYVKEMRKSEKGRAILFFGFFFIFFLALAIIARLDPGEAPEYEPAYTPDVSIDQLLDNNFSYIYTIEADTKTYTVTGKINEGMEEFTYDDGTNSTKYYRNGENYLIYQKDMWVKGSEPTNLFKFFNTKSLNKLIKKATYDSKTDYQSGRVNHHFLISTNTINKVLDKINSDFDEVPNELDVIFNEKKDIEEIKFSLNSYGVNNKLVKKDLTIRLQYDDIGKIGVIKNPLDE
ncbi:MAG: hypothetical protein IJI43_03330 [Bacilli bacterium]|nr:hypothetical protein [Bacilli bacterium]